MIWLSHFSLNGFTGQLDNEGELSNYFSINQLVGQNIILNKRT